MLVIAILLMALTASYIFFRRRDILGLYLLLMCAALAVMLTGVMTSISKSGGFSEEIVKLMFLSKRIKIYLQSMPISLGKVGYTIAVGRTLFPWFLLCMSVEFSMLKQVRRNKFFIKCISFVPTAMLLVYYYPKVFKWLMTGRFSLLVAGIYTVRVGIAIYVVTAFALLIIEDFSITERHCRREFHSIVLGTFGITALYAVYAIQDPAQVYTIFINEYISIRSLTYINRAITAYGYAAVFLFICFMIMAVMGLVAYTQFEYIEYRVDKSLKRKFDSRSVGISVFAHSIKNQILANKVLSKKIRRKIGGSIESDPELKLLVDKQDLLIEEMLSGLNTLYHSLYDRGAQLKPMRIKKLFKDLSLKAENMNLNAKLSIDLRYDATLLMDEEKLSQALISVIKNADEAGASTINLKVEKERLYHLIKITDDGKGMNRDQLKTVFEPFKTTKSSATNWGLGLYLVRNTVKNHYGKIKIDSAVDEGTTFTIMLPKYPERVEDKDV